MKKKLFSLALLVAAMMPSAWGATFGRVVAIGGHASDLALDEPRGVLYIANFTANRIDVMSLSDYQVRRQINVAAQPSSLSVSPDGKYLLVAHYGNFKDTPAVNGLTLIDLNTNGRQTFTLGVAPLGVSFGVDNRALVVTEKDFELFDPRNGIIQVIQTIEGFKSVQLPVAPANFPPNIVTASVAASGNGRYIAGLTDTFQFVYDVVNRAVNVLYYTSTPAQGPRVVSMNYDGTSFTSGWTASIGFDKVNAIALSFLGRYSQWPDPAGLLNIGSHVIDSKRQVIYAQVPPSSAKGSNNNLTVAPTMTVNDIDNLYERAKFNIPENLAGKSVISSDSEFVYAISDSGVTVLPVGQLDRAPQIQVTDEDVLFRGNYCERRVTSQTLLITDPSGSGSDFTIASDNPNVTVTPSSGVAPARVTILVNANAFQNQKGTVAVNLTVTSRKAANVPKPARVLVNLRDPDQRGSAVSVSGKLVDLLADPARNRFYVLRQDNNTVMVFDGSNFSKIATLKTGNTPTQLAMTFDRQYLMIGADNSQFISVYDLDTLKESDAILMPGGHYPRSIAVSASDILVATRVAGPKHKIDRVDFYRRYASELPTLGVFQNDIDVNTMLVGSSNGGSILGVSKDGTTRLYRDGTWTVRKDFDSLSGAYAASDLDQYVVGNQLLNSSLVTVGQFETATGAASGFYFMDGMAYRTTTASASQPGTIQRVDLATGTSSPATRLIEAPLVGDTSNAFSRTLAVLNNRATIINLTTSGFTALPINYDASVAPPRISNIANAADGTAPVAPGGLISIYGTQLSPVSQASATLPLPTALADSCLVINGQPVPVLYVSPTQINAQLPLQATGNVTLVLRTPGGVSDNYNVRVSTSAPSVFRTSVGDLTGVATMVRASNNELVTPSNPIHRGDVVVVYLTGLGATNPAVEAGQAAGSDQLATAVTQPVVTLGGVGLPVAFAGLTPGFPGLYQINLNIPRNVPEGLSVPLVISGGGNSTSFNVRVVN